MKFATTRFLEDNWRDADGVVKMMTSYGREVDKMMVYQWWRRASIPARWFPILLALAEFESGAPVSLVPYLTS